MTEIIKQYTIQFTLTDSDAKVFESILIKLLVETRKAGYKKFLSKDEICLIQEINSKLGENEENNYSLYYCTICAFNSFLWW